MWLRAGHRLLVGISGGEAPGGIERGITQEAMDFVDATMCWDPHVRWPSQTFPLGLVNPQPFLPFLSTNTRAGTQIVPGSFLCRQVPVGLTVAQPQHEAA